MIIERQVEAKMQDDKKFAYFVTKSLLQFFERDWGDTADYHPEEPAPDDPCKTGAFYRYGDGDWIKIRYKGRDTEVKFARADAKSPSKRQQLNELLYQHSMELQVFYMDLLMLLHKEAEENHTW